MTDTGLEITSVTRLEIASLRTLKVAIVIENVTRLGRTSLGFTD
jgi:hypothetical protein